MEHSLCIDLPYGITTVDTGYHRPRFDAAHLIVERGEAAIVDTGSASSVPRLLRALADKGLAPEAVRYVMVTHVHLDHAGGAGVLLRHLPNARLVVHPRGASHMIDPAKLIAGATAVYGEARFRALYGEVVPVAAERVIEAPDNFQLDFNGRPLLFLDTPGHARHHYCIYDAASRGIFSGDTFGLSYREFDTEQGPFLFPTTTPVQFDPEALHASIERLLSFNPERMYLTHFGAIGNVVPLAARLHRGIDAFVALARACAAADDRRAALTAALNGWLLEALADHGCRMPRERALALLAVDVELNAQGLDLWLARNPGGAG
jgi:glyoxylase-like metal-dependent hydrolase (beta-lactamase superfamily II)